MGILFEALIFSCKQSWQRWKDRKALNPDWYKHNAYVPITDAAQRKALAEQARGWFGPGPEPSREEVLKSYVAKIKAMQHEHTVATQ